MNTIINRFIVNVFIEKTLQLQSNNTISTSEYEIQFAIEQNIHKYKYIIVRINYKILN